MRILLIQDGEDCLDAVLKEVKKDFILDVSRSYTDGSFLCSANEYDAVVILECISDIHGLDVCKNVRYISALIPLLYVSGSATVQQKVSILEAGADAYISKPLDINELRACIKALIRRKCLAPSSKEVLHNNIRLNLKARKVYVDDIEVYLRRKEFDLLEYMLLNKNRVLSVETILEHVWEIGLNAVSNTVSVHIRSIRAKLGSDLIKTRHGFGYVIEG